MAIKTDDLVRVFGKRKAETYPASPFVFRNETAALVAFGTSWLTKGGALYPDKKQKSMSTKVTEKKS